MINIKFKDQTYGIKNKANELTIKEFEQISLILNLNNSDKVTAYMEVLTYLGLPEEVIDNMDYDEFISIITNYIGEDYGNFDMVKEITIDGYTYVAYDDEFKLKVRDMGLIETYIKRNPNKYLGELMAILYKRIDLSKNEHYEDAHIKHKASLFRDNVTVDKALPYVSLFTNKLINNLKTVKDGLPIDTE